MLIGLGAAGGGMEIIISSSLSLQAHAHTCAQTHFFYSREKQWQVVLWQGRLSPVCLFACHSLAKEQQINVLCFLLPEEKRGEDPASPPEGFTPSSRSSAWQQRQQRQQRALLVRCGVIVKCRGTCSANDHPGVLFLWTVFSIGLFSWIRSFYPTFWSGKQQVSLQRDMREFSNPENLCLFFMLLFSCSKMSENSLTQLIHWIYTLSHCKLTSPSSAFFFPVITQNIRAVSQDGNGAVKSGPNVKHGFKVQCFFSFSVVIWLGTSHPCD